LSSLEFSIVLYMAGYLTRLYARSKSSGNCSRKKTYLLVPAHSLDLTVSLVSICSRPYKSRISPFVWSTSIDTGILVAPGVLSCCLSLVSTLIE
jgi:hypothetical protein